MAFEGSLRPEYVGDWRTANGLSQMILERGGALSLVTAIRSPQGVSRSNRSGRWLVAPGGELRLKYAEADAKEVVVGYRAQVEANRLRLRTGGRGLETVYLRTRR